MQVGIVGAGQIAKFHMKGYEEAGANVVAVADLDSSRASSLAGLVGADFYNDYREMLARPDIGAVSVCLPNHLHYQSAVDALRAGKHVLCEKPMTTTLADARELAHLAEESGRCFQIAYMKRFMPAFQMAHEAISEIGNLLSATVKVFHWFPDEMWGKADEWWGLNRETSGGGPLVHAGSHVIDILNWWFGPISTVSARIRMKEDLRVDDHTAATLITESGLTIFFECAWLPLSRIGYNKDGWDERIEVTGDRGRVDIYSTWWDKTEQMPLVRVYKEGEPEREERVPLSDAFAGEVRAFVKGCSNGGNVKPDARDGLAVQEVIEAMYLSARRGSGVSMKEL